MKDRYDGQALIRQYGTLMNAYQSNIRTAELASMMKAGARPWEQDVEAGMDILSEGIIRNDLKFCWFLLEYGMPLPPAGDQKRLALIGRALQLDDMKFMAQLVRRGIDLQRDFKGSTFLHWAVSYFSAPGIRFGLRHGQRIDARSDSGMLPAAMIIESMSNKPQQEVKNAIKVMLEVGFDFNDLHNGKPIRECLISIDRLNALLEAEREYMASRLSVSQAERVNPTRLGPRL